MNKTVIIGGGAAGMMAAVFSAEKGNQTVLLEKRKTWKKDIHNGKRTL